MAIAITTEEALLRKTTGIKPKKTEDRQDFLVRLLDSVDKLDDGDWEKMGQEDGGTGAQQWCNDAIDARKEEAELPDFEVPDEPEAEDEAEPETTNGKEDEDEAEDEAEDEPEEEEEPVKAKKAKKVEKKAAKPTAKAAKAAKPEKGAKAAKAAKEPEKPAKTARASAGNGTLDGIKVRIKNMVCDYPHISLEDLLTKLQKGGDKMSRMTVSSVRSETRHTLRVLKQRGNLKGIEI